MAEDPVQLLKIIQDIYETFEFDPPNAKSYVCEEAELYRDLHAEFVLTGFENLPKSMQGVDSGQPWILYWLTQALEVLHCHGKELSEDQKTRIVKYLSQCQNKETGGFAGSPYLQSHVASTYAAILALVNVGTKEAFELVDVEGMKRFLLKMKNNNFTQHVENNVWQYVDSEGKLIRQEGCAKLVATLPGSISIHENGEMDMRGVYCSLVVADILNILEGNDEFIKGMGDFIAASQTYEGGITCVPFAEAHGGYTFCGLASMLLLKETEKLDIGRLIEWLCNRQLTEEGGFNGRINKLVDSCYNFWQGASFELVDMAVQGKANVNGEWLYNQEALQGYTILCCQESSGGVKDKPMKRPDMYHTCYALSGLSVAQHKSDYKNLLSPDAPEAETFTGLYHHDQLGKTLLMSGIQGNKVRRIHPIYNLRYDKVARARQFFRQKK